MKREHLCCPHCGEESLTVFQKLSLGAMMSRKCEVCGWHFGVSAIAWLAMVPTFISVVLAEAADTLVPKLLCWGVGIFVSSLFYLYGVPLVSKE